MENLAENARNPSVSSVCEGLDAAAYVFLAICLLASAASAAIGVSLVGFADQRTLRSIPTILQDGRRLREGSRYSAPFLSL